MTRRRFLTSSLALAAQAKGPIEVGITTNTRGGWENDVFLSFREAHQVGYRNVESFIHYFVKYWDRPGDLQAEIERIGVRFVTISNGGPLEMHFEDPARRGQLLADHLKLGRFIRNFGCRHLKINLGPRRAEGTTDEDLKNIAETLEQLGRKLKAEDVRLAPHAHMWSQFENRREIDYVMGHTSREHVAFVLDTGHITMAGIDPVELARNLGPRIVEFHMKDTAKEHRGGAKVRFDRPDMMKQPLFFPLGSGGVDFPGLKQHLDTSGWHGWFTVELDTSPYRPPMESARISRRYLDKNLSL